MSSNLRVDADRLMERLQALGRVGALPERGVRRLALSDEDKAGRDQVVAWMRELGLAVAIDQIGNIIAVCPGQEDGPPMMMGSHVDTVAAGGIYDGNLGVLAGLEVIATVKEAGITTRRPLAVAAFTNEEGARFAPDMMGSLVYVGGLALEEARATRGIDGALLGDELDRIGYAGKTPCGALTPHAFVELHVEQGPILEAEGVTIGAVDGVQGISWQEITIEGEANHAGTTPMRLRHDAGYAAGAVIAHVREIARGLGEQQVATCGLLSLEPNLVNVIPGKALLTVDLRNAAEAALQEAERRLAAFLDHLAEREGVRITTRRLARFEPVIFDPALVGVIEATAQDLGFSVRHISSGAGHDAQMLARICPTAMIFVPSAGGISHNPAEYTAPEDIAAGANVLLQTVLELAS